MPYALAGIAIGAAAALFLAAAVYCLCCRSKQVTKPVLLFCSGCCSKHCAKLVPKTLTIETLSEM